MNFPLNLSFKILAMAPQVNVTDSAGNNICYVRQKIMKFKEQIEVFTDKNKTEKICEIRANKVIDFSATYQFFDANGQPFGAVARKGMKSLWKANYDILDGENVVMNVREENPWIKVVDGLLGQIPIVGAVTGYFFNPSYIISSAATGEALIRIKKTPAFFEGKFVIDKIGSFETDEEMKMVVSTLMIVLLERTRG